LFLVIALSVFGACSGGDPVENARQALSAGQLIEAVEISSRALQGGSNLDAKTRWALERIRLEALAKSGEGDRAFETLTSLAATYPAQVDAALFLTTSAWTRTAGDPAGAARILDDGKKRYPDQAAKFIAAIDEIKQSAGKMDASTTQRLRSLGYLE